jgi:hypothetical protein
MQFHWKKRGADGTSALSPPRGEGVFTSLSAASVSGSFQAMARIIDSISRKE